MSKTRNVKSAAAVAGAAPCSAENVCLPNDTKIRFCNALDALRRHAAEGTSGECAACSIYMRIGDGDLCEKGKDLIAREMAYTDTNIEFPPNSVLGDTVAKTKGANNVDKTT